jgi:integrase
MLAAAGGTLRDLRNKALLTVAYTTLCSRSELVALHRADLETEADGCGTDYSVTAGRAGTIRGPQSQYHPAETHIGPEFVRGRELAARPPFSFRSRKLYIVQR